jgi:ATP-dependent DNA ligase
MNMIKQCKGKDINKISKSKLCTECEYFASIKYDGQYVQIHKIGNKVKFFTSGGKEFYLRDIAIDLIRFNQNVDFILEAEFIGESKGKLGDRTKCGILTTWRTEYTKGYTHLCSNNKFKVFDIIIEGIPFERRLNILKSLKLPKQLELVEYKSKKLQEAKRWLYDIIKHGYEGVYLKAKNHFYVPGKRLNTAIKLKKRPTADLRCVDILEGEGKYEGLIGALLLIDSEGRIVSVGSGLQDWERQLPKKHFLGKIIEIEYEQILDTYIQPTYVRIREDKVEED